MNIRKAAIAISMAAATTALAGCADLFAVQKQECTVRYGEEPKCVPVTSNTPASNSSLASGPK